MKTKHEIMLLGSYLMHSSSILLWSLVSSLKAEDLRLKTWFRSSREHVCLSDEWYSFIHVLLMFIYRWRILFRYTCSTYVYIAELFSYTYVLFICIGGYSLRYKQAGRGFDFQWSQDFSPWHNPAGRTMAMGSTQPLTEMSTRCVSCHQECSWG